MAGPLSGVRVVELAGLGAAPFGGMVLADLGADVVRVDRPPSGDQVPFVEPRRDLHNRGKLSIAVDLKDRLGVEVVHRLIGESDILIEGFRPGVAERIGVGPADALALNTSLVYARMTGWGQDGPYSAIAGHDIDYIAVSGVLHGIGSPADPQIPLNLLGDFAGGGMLLVVGVLAALLHARATGAGQAVDVAMVDGSALLMTSIHGMMNAGLWSDQRSSNLLDGAAPFYTVYATADDRHMAVGALESQFFAELVRLLDVGECPPQGEISSWPKMRDLFQERFSSEDQEHWIEVFAGSDACVAPVRSIRAAVDDPHMAARSSFIDVGGIKQPAPAPRFSATPPETPSVPAFPGQHTDSILSSLGYSQEQISKLRADKAVF